MTESVPEGATVETAEERQRKQEEQEELAVEKLKNENDLLKERIEQLQLDVKTLSAKFPKVKASSFVLEHIFQNCDCNHRF